MSELPKVAKLFMEASKKGLDMKIAKLLDKNDIKVDEEAGAVLFHFGLTALLDKGIDTRGLIEYIEVYETAFFVYKLGMIIKGKELIKWNGLKG